MLFPNLLKKKSYNCCKKTLFFDELNNKIIKKHVYMFSYYSEQKAETYYEFCKTALLSSAYLICLPSAYTLFKRYCLQGPKIFMIVIKSLNITNFLSFISVKSITIFINNKWYAFCILFELFNYKNILKICSKFLKENNRKMFFGKKIFKNLKDIAFFNFSISTN